MTQSLLGFQDAHSSSMVHISMFHDQIMMVAAFVVTVVIYSLVYILSSKNSGRFIVENETLEFVWTLLPTLILACLAIPSLQTLYLVDDMPTPYLTVKVVGSQWFWEYEYDSYPGVRTSTYLTPSINLDLGASRLLDVDCNTVLPVGVETRLVVTSTDVIHSWTVPSLGTKIDAVPGRLNQVFLNLTRLGTTYGQCSEICGPYHSFMPIVVESVPIEGFKAWVKDNLPRDIIFTDWWLYV